MRHYLAVDGGAGGARLVQLARALPSLRPAASPRQAQLLLAWQPISRELAPSIAALYDAMPRPCRLVLIGPADAATWDPSHKSALRIRADLDVVEIGHRLVAAELHRDDPPLGAAFEPGLIALADKREAEMATEPVVLSLGPVQGLTAGPLRLLLVADGEQVSSVQVQAGYAQREIARQLRVARGVQALHLAGMIDPLAPRAGRIAYLSAVERLRGTTPPAEILRRREAALALERAQNHLTWLARFGAFLHAPRMLDGIASLDPRLGPDAACALFSLRGRIRGDRFIRLRTAGIGLIPLARLQAVGAGGPNLRASEGGLGDVLSRLLTRLDEAAEDFAGAAPSSEPCDELEDESSVEEPMPAGNAYAEVEGPRGRIGVRLKSDGQRLAVEVQRPSAAMLQLVPELLVGNTLADAQAIVASLDLAMAEADG